MTDMQDGDDYFAFLRGYVAALNRLPAALAMESPEYLEGYFVAARPVVHTERYRDLSIEHEPAAHGPMAGSFTGTLADLLRSSAA